MQRIGNIGIQRLFLVIALLALLAACQRYVPEYQPRLGSPAPSGSSNVWRPPHVERGIDGLATYNALPGVLKTG